MQGFNPVKNGSGQYTCLNGSPASAQPGQPGANVACISQYPLANSANCPQGYQYKSDPNLGGAMVCLRTPQESACRQQGMDLGLNNTCQQICPPGSGDYPFPITQCCQDGVTVQPNGSCGPPPASSCQPKPGGTVYCTPLSAKLCLSPPCCPQGAQSINGTCVATGTPPTCNDGSTATCCSAGQTLSRVTGQCISPPPPPCPSGDTGYCAPQPGACLASQKVTDGCCPGGSIPFAGSCIAVQSNCGLAPLTGSPVQRICCPAGQVPDFLNGGCLTPPVPPPQTPPSIVCRETGTMLFCPPGVVLDCQPGQRLPNGLCCPVGSAPAGSTSNGGNACIETGPSCGSAGPGICCTYFETPNFTGQQCCPPNQTVENGACVCKGVKDAAGTCCAALTPTGMCPGIGLKPPLFCPPDSVKIQGGGCQACGPGFAPGGPNNATCVRVSTLTTPTIPLITTTPETPTPVTPPLGACPGNMPRSWRGCEPPIGATAPSGVIVTAPTTPTTTQPRCKPGERGCEKDQRSVTPTTPVVVPRKIQTPANAKTGPTIQRPLKPLTSNQLNFGKRR